MDKSLKKITYFCLTIFLLVLSGCKAPTGLRMPSFKNKSIAHLTNATADYKTSNSNIIASCKLIKTEQECEQLFGKNGKNLLNRKNKIYPIQVTLENKTNKTWLLPQENLGLKTISIKQVLQRTGYWTGLRACLTGGTLLGGTAMLGIFIEAPLGTGFAFGPPAIASISFVALVPCLTLTAILIPAIPLLTLIHAIKSHNANKRLKKFLIKTSLINQMVIKPGQTVSLLFFVKETCLKQAFSLVLHDTQDNGILCNMKMNHLPKAKKN